MAMRPWNRFLAQVLQFQCQLSDLLRGMLGDGLVPLDPCAENRVAIGDAKHKIEELLQIWAAAKVELISELGKHSVDALEGLRKLLGSATTGGETSSDGQRILIDGGIVELPPAGYLPVNPGDQLDIPEQVRRWMGPGVDLRFCVVDSDDVPRELVGAQHMDRISLLTGIDDPAAKPPVDVLVPDGTLIIHEDPGLTFRAGIGLGEFDYQNLEPAHGFNGELELGLKLDGDFDQLIDALNDKIEIRLRGAARVTPNVSGGGSFYLAAGTSFRRAGKLDLELLRGMRKLSPLGLEKKVLWAVPEVVPEGMPAAVPESESEPMLAPPRAMNPEYESEHLELGKLQPTAIWIELGINTDLFLPSSSSAEVSGREPLSLGRQLQGRAA
jgi:hypothetical protein